MGKQITWSLFWILGTNKHIREGHHSFRGRFKKISLALLCLFHQLSTVGISLLFDSSDLVLQIIFDYYRYDSLSSRLFLIGINYEKQTHRPHFVMIISVPILWNSDHKSSFCNLTSTLGREKRGGTGGSCLVGKIDE